MSVEGFLCARSVFGINASAGRRSVACLHHHFPRSVRARSSRWIRNKTHPLPRWHEGQEFAVDVRTPPAGSRLPTSHQESFGFFQFCRLRLEGACKTG